MIFVIAFQRRGGYCGTVNSFHPLVGSYFRRTRVGSQG